MSGMAPKRKLAVIRYSSMACFIIWGAILIPRMPPTHSYKWVLYLLFYALPLPMVFVLYLYIRACMLPYAKTKSIGFHIFSGLPWGLIAIWLVRSGLPHRRDPFVFPYICAVAGMFLALSIVFFYRAAKAPREQPPSAQAG